MVVEELELHNTHNCICMRAVLVFPAKGLGLHFRVEEELAKKFKTCYYYCSSVAAAAKDPHFRPGDQIGSSTTFFVNWISSLTILIWKQQSSNRLTRLFLAMILIGIPVVWSSTTSST